MLKKSFFTKKEWEALRGERFILKVFYFYLKMNMDPNTFISGEHRKFNLSDFEQELCEETFRGRHCGKIKKISRYQIRDMIKRLEDKKLIRYKGCYVFEHVLAQRDYYEQNLDTTPTPRRHHADTTVIHREDEDNSLKNIENDICSKFVDNDQYNTGKAVDATSRGNRGNIYNKNILSSSDEEDRQMFCENPVDNFFEDNFEPKLDGEPESMAEPTPPEKENSKIPNCPHEIIITLYHEKLPTLRKVVIWNDFRKSLLRQRWREYPDLKWWENYFEEVSKSDFLMGRVKEFAADLEWLIRPKNFVKVVEGKYQSSRKVGKHEQFNAGTSYPRNNQYLNVATVAEAFWQDIRETFQQDDGSTFNHEELPDNLIPFKAVN